MQWEIPPQPWVIGLDGGISGWKAQHVLTQEASLGVSNDFFLLSKLLIKSVSFPTSWEPSPEGEIPYQSPINSTLVPDCEDFIGAEGESLPDTLKTVAPASHQTCSYNTTGL